MLRAIRDGGLNPGDRLPGEHELSRRFGVSMAPVRQALGDLQRAGYLSRARGRGSFVESARIEDRLGLLASYSARVRASGREPEVEWLDHSVTHDPRIARRLGLLPHDALLRLQRLGRADGEPLALLVSWLSADRHPGLAVLAAECQSLYAALERMGTLLSRASSQLEVVAATQPVATALGVAEGSPLVLISGVTEDSSGQPVEVSEVHYRAYRFRFTVESWRPASARSAPTPSPKGRAATTRRKGNHG